MRTYFLFLIVIILVLASGCTQVGEKQTESITPNTPLPSSTKPVTGTSTQTTTPTQDSPIAIEDPLIEYNDSYILFSSNENGIWSGGSLHFSDHEIVLTRFENEYYPIGWSPTGIHLLMRKSGEGLYLTNVDGTQLNKIFEPNTGYICLGTWWLKDDIILVTVCENEYDWRLGILDITSGEFYFHEPNTPRLIEAVSPTGEFWIERVFNIEMVQLDSSRKQILEGYYDGSGGLQPDVDPRIIFTPSGSGVLFVGCDTTNPIMECNIYSAQVNEFEFFIPIPIIEVEDGNTSIGISPDGNLLAYVDSSDYLNILNLTTNEINYRWPWINPRGPNYFFSWSPDSTAIAASTTIDGAGSIVVIDIRTGETSLLVSEPGIGLDVLDWRYINR